MLRSCGLRTSASPQEILDAIYSISLPADETPQLVGEQTFASAKAVLKYIGTKDEFISKSALPCTFLPSDLHQGDLPFLDALAVLSKKRSWLPILCKRPLNYPQALPWKGEEMFSHLSTLTASLSISTASKPSQPLLYGSQLYFTEPKISYDVLKSEESPGLLVSQLQCVITHCKDISQDNLVDTLHKIYFAMLEVVQKGSLSDLAAPSSFNFDKWIYLKGAKQFVSPNILAVEHNPSL